MEFPPDLPPIVYLPTESYSASKDDLRVEYRMTKDGRKALLIYSAMDRLVAAMGPFQPWVVCPLVGLNEIWKEDAFDVVYLDIAVPEDHRRTPTAS